VELSSSWEATSCAATQEFSSILRTVRFITQFTRALHRSYLKTDQSSPHHPILRYILCVLPSPLGLGLPSGLFPSGFQTKILHAFLFFLWVLHALPHLILLDLMVLYLFFTRLLQPIGAQASYSVPYSFFTDSRTSWTHDQHVVKPLPKHRTTQTQNTRIYTPNIHALSGIRTHYLSVRASEDS
jgi:hypothetical protein